jgi:hypothetical protein
MNSPKMQVVAYCMAIGFILAVALHSPAKFVAAAGVSAPTAASDAK